MEHNSLPSHHPYCGFAGHGQMYLGQAKELEVRPRLRSHASFLFWLTRSGNAGGFDEEISEGGDALFDPIAQKFEHIYRCICHSVALRSD